jgi:general secretion pathway protein A
MYEEFFGLKERPFDLTSNPRYLFLTSSHREALSSLEYGLSARTGVTVLVGEAGTGKTTLIRATLDAREGSNTHAIYLNNPTLTRGEFLEFLAREFSLPAAAGVSKTALLSELERTLVELHAQGVTPALIIDEAQSLPYELLEEIRLLANIETATEKLLPIVLAGQPELAERLNHPSLRQLKQRVGLRCQLRQLELGETGAYITARVAVAGGTASRMFTREAVTLIHERSQGIPRTISVICHNALISAFAMNAKPVTADIVREVCQDFDLKGGGSLLTPLTTLPSTPVQAPPVVPKRQAQSGALAERVQLFNRIAPKEMFASVGRARRRYLIF